MGLFKSRVTTPAQAAEAMRALTAKVKIFFMLLIYLIG
jgi:hypothetical protein